MCMKVGVLNGEKYTFMFKNASPSSNLFEVKILTTLSEKALDALRKIMSWDTMPFERLLNHIEEGFLVSHKELCYLMGK